MSDNKKVKCDYCGADTPQDKITKRDCFNFCGFCVEELKDAKETRWNAETSPERIQGTICEDGTGRTVAVAYDRKDAPLIAAAPAMLEVVEWVYKHWGIVPRAIEDKASDIINDLREEMKRNGNEWED